MFGLMKKNMIHGMHCPFPLFFVVFESKRANGDFLIQFPKK